MAENTPQSDDLTKRLMDPDPARAEQQVSEGQASLDTAPNAVTGSLDESDLAQDSGDDQASGRP